MVKWVKFLLGPAAAPPAAPLGLLAPAKPDLGRRSGKWPRVRAEHLAREPACAACGRAEELQVHHCRPFHEFPDLELADSNLVTLCEGTGRNCHYTFGHCYDWHESNPHVREDAAAFRARLEAVRKKSA